MKILVAGACGYIGSALTTQLCVNQEYRVVAADYRISSSLREVCRYGNLDIVQADCRNRKEVASLIKDADVIYWLVGATAGTESDLRATNVETAKNLAACVGKEQVIVYAQTNAGYRPKNGIATEETPMIGGSVYSQTKIDAEFELLGTGRCVSFRLAAVYGPAPTIRWETLLNYMIYHAVKHPDRKFEIYQPYATRDVLFMPDLIERLEAPLYSILAAARSPAFNGEIYNLSGQSMRKIDLLECVFTHKMFAGQPKRKFVSVSGADPDQRDFRVSEEKFRRDYESDFGGSLPTTDIDDGIERTIKAAMLEA